MTNSENGCISVLFLRSAAQPIITAHIAMGLDLADEVNFEQYPAVPERKWDKIENMYDPESARTALRKNIISKDELINKITSRYYDLVLLCDQTGELFYYNSLGILRKTRNLLGQFKKLTKESLNEIIEEIEYMRGIPLSVNQINSLSPVAAIDLGDYRLLNQYSRDILKDVSLYFKRELPYNRYQLYVPEKPAPWSYWQTNLIKDLIKIRNIPLGIEDNKYYHLKKNRSNLKDIDVFYCCNDSSTLRIRVKHLLKTIRDSSPWNIHIDDNLTFEEYCNKMARSKVTISVSGGGWDCHRHYEAVASGSLPFIDRPVVEMIWWGSAPNSIFFEKSLDDMEERLDILLRSDDRRLSDFETLEKHVEDNMLHSKILTSIIEYSLANHKKMPPIEDIHTITR